MLVRPGQATPPLQLEDLLRHSGQAKKRCQSHTFHAQAAHWYVFGDGESGSAEAAPDEPTQASLPLAAFQVRTSVDVARSPNAAQSLEYEERCSGAHKLNPAVCPLGRSGRETHWKVQRSLCEVLLESQRAMMKEKGILAVGLAQDCL